MTHHFSGGGVGEWAPKGQLKEEGRNNMSHHFSGGGLREWASKGQLEEEGRNNMIYYFSGEEGAQRPLRKNAFRQLCAECRVSHASRSERHALACSLSSPYLRGRPGENCKSAWRGAGSVRRSARPQLAARGDVVGWEHV